MNRVTRRVREKEGNLKQTLRDPTLQVFLSEREILKVLKSFCQQSENKDLLRFCSTPNSMCN